MSKTNMMRYFLEDYSKKEKADSLSYLIAYLQDEENRFTGLEGHLVRNLIPLISSEIKKMFKIPKKPKTLFEWLMCAVSKDEDRENITFARQFDEYAVATDGSCLHQVYGVLPEFKGKNAFKRGVPLDVDLSYPDVESRFLLMGDGVDFSTLSFKTLIKHVDIPLMSVTIQDNLLTFDPKKIMPTINFLESQGCPCVVSIGKSGTYPPLVFSFHVDGIECKSVVMQKTA